MKLKNKRFLILCSSLFSLGTLVTVVASACASNKKEQKESKNELKVVENSWLNNNENWIKNSYFRDPYKINQLFANQLDKVFNFNNLKQKLPQQMQSFNSFSDWSKHNAQLIKDDVLAVAGQTKSQNLRDKKATVLVLQNRKELTNNKESYNAFSIITPPDFPLLYANPNEEVPGLGLSFPHPVDDKASNLVDKTPSIGRAALINNPAQTVLDLTSSFYKTADYVFYMYDSNLFTNQEHINKTYEQDPSKREEFLESLLNNNDFYAKDFLKNENSKIIFVDRTWFWWGEFGFSGMSYILDKLIEIFELDNIQKKYHVFEPQQLTKIFDTKPTELQRNEIINPNIVDNKTLTYGYKVVSTWPDSVDQLISFGIKPNAIVDYASFTDVSVRTSSLSPFLKRYVDYDNLLQEDRITKSPRDSESKEYSDRDFGIYVASAHLYVSAEKLIKVPNTGSWVIGTSQGLNEESQTKAKINLNQSQL